MLEELRCGVFQFAFYFAEIFSEALSALFLSVDLGSDLLECVDEVRFGFFDCMKDGLPNEVRVSYKARARACSMG